jgi:hypothetical protein
MTAFLHRLRLAGSVLLFSLVIAACGMIGPSKEDVEDAVIDLMPVVAQWRPEVLEPYGTTAFHKRISRPDQQRMFRVFSRLGTLDSFQPPRMTGWSSSTEHGTQVRVEVDARFSRGPALVVMTLQTEDGTLKLHALNIRSPVFGDPDAKESAPQLI